MNKEESELFHPVHALNVEEKRQQELRQERLAQAIAYGFDNSYLDNEDNAVRIRCSQCAAAVINGVPCHENGCPNRNFECDECEGGRVPRKGMTCDGCLQAQEELIDDCLECCDCGDEDCEQCQLVASLC